MNKIFLLLIILLLSFNVVCAQEDWFFNSQNLIINVDVSSEAEIKPQSPDYTVEYINVNLSHFPYESFNQKVLKFDIEPEADIENNNLLFSWDNPKDKVSYGYKTKIKTINDIVKIKSKVPFPITDLPEDIEQFTKPQEIIDSDDDEIIKLASKLVEGENDLYVVVHDLAEWTKNNINYNLSTLTAEASQKASWVLTNRQGVCDELTSLFIAMLRAVGVPAKFVSGVAYTNSPLFPENWGSHGWAEVYFPGFGWVPYDVTYGQFGYIDPTHIKLKESIDSSEPSVQYRWLARNVDLKTQNLDIDTSLEEVIGRVKKPIRADVNVLKDNIGFGSYNLIEVSLENLESYYLSSEIYISKPQEVEISENFVKNVILKPKEKKSIFWIVRLTNYLESGFIYTFPITISTLRNFTASTNFKSSKNDIVLSLDEINEILQQKKEEEEKIYSRDVDTDCSINKAEFYSYENALWNCRIKNLGNIFLEDLNLCFRQDCKKFDLGIAQEKEFSFAAGNFEAGKQEISLNLKNADVSKANYIDINVLDPPNVKIMDSTAPKEVSYGDKYQISFLLSKQSSSNPNNAKITLSQNNFKETWDVKELFNDRKFIINLQAKDLRKGANEFAIIVEYEDKNGRPYEAHETLIVQLTNVTLAQNVLLAGNRFITNLENFNYPSLLFVILGSFAIFAIVVWYVFRKK